MILFNWWTFEAISDKYFILELQAVNYIGVTII
jgi:hypothetical protein